MATAPVGLEALAAFPVLVRLTGQPACQRGLFRMDGVVCVCNGRHPWREVAAIRCLHPTERDPGLPTADDPALKGLTIVTADETRLLPDSRIDDLPTVPCLRAPTPAVPWDGRRDCRTGPS